MLCMHAFKTFYKVTTEKQTIILSEERVCVRARVCTRVCTVCVQETLIKYLRVFLVR